MFTEHNLISLLELMVHMFIFAEHNLISLLELMVHMFIFTEHNLISMLELMVHMFIFTEHNLISLLELMVRIQTYLPAKGVDIKILYHGKKFYLTVQSLYNFMFGIHRIGRCYK